MLAGSLLGAAAVVLGAAGSHALPVSDESRWWLANGYHLAHAVVLAILAVSVRRSSVWLMLSLCSFLAGTLLFSGSLYLLALEKIATASAAPFGGILLITGWLSLGLHGALSTDPSG